MCGTVAKFNKLSRPSIRKLLPGNKITEHGITFERVANGDGVFSINVMADGHRIHRVIGRASNEWLYLSIHSGSSDALIKEAHGEPRGVPAARCEAAQD
jgi:hypothetical protein